VEDRWFEIVIRGHTCVLSKAKLRDGLQSLYFVSAVVNFLYLMIKCLLPARHKIL
jgi:hypothetical protein